MNVERIAADLVVGPLLAEACITALEAPMGRFGLLPVQRLADLLVDLLDSPDVGGNVIPG